VEPLLSLIIPIYNEASHLESWFDALLKQKFPCRTEFIVVDDASTDGSNEIIARIAAKEKRIKSFIQPVNQGKGAALQRGIAESTGDIVIIQDADFEYSIKDVERVVQPIIDDRADVVFGSRFKSSQTVHRTFHYAINRFLTFASNVASGLYLTDMETCYKAFRGDIIRNVTIASPRFGFEPEITAKIAALRVRVQEVPIDYFPRTYLEGKKIRWTDGVAALWHIARFNLDSASLRKALKAVPDKYKPNGRQWL